MSENMKGVDRRNFIKAMAATGAAVAVGGKAVAAEERADLYRKLAALGFVKKVVG